MYDSGMCTTTEIVSATPTRHLLHRLEPKSMSMCCRWDWMNVERLSDSFWLASNGDFMLYGTVHLIDWIRSCVEDVPKRMTSNGIINDTNAHVTIGIVHQLTTKVCSPISSAIVFADIESLQNPTSNKLVLHSDLQWGRLHAGKEKGSSPQKKLCIDNLQVASVCVLWRKNWPFPSFS